MVRPGNEQLPGSGAHGSLRASHADRDRVVDVLKVAFVQGCLTKDEFDLRVGEAFASRTYSGLHALTADLPAGLAHTQPLEPVRGPGDEPGGGVSERTAVRMIAAVLVAVPSAAFAVGLMESGTRPELSAAARVLYIIVFACIVALPAAALVMFHSWLASRPGRHQPPWPPRPDGCATGRPAPEGPGRQPGPAEHDPRHGALWAAARILAGPRYPPFG